MTKSASRLLALVSLATVSCAVVLGVPARARAADAVDRPCPLGSLATLEDPPSLATMTGVSPEQLASLRDEYARLQATADRLEARRREQEAHGCARSRVGSTQDSRCVALKTEIEVAWSAYDQRLDAYEDARRRAHREGLARAAASLAAIESRLHATRLQLAALALYGERWTKDAQEWTELSKGAHVAFFVDALVNVTRAGLEEVAETRLAAARVSEDTKQEVTAWWSARNAAFPVAYRRAIDERIRSLRTTADLANLVRHLVDQGARAYSMIEGSGALSASGHAVVGMLGIYLAVIESPLLVLVEVLDRGVAAGYGVLVKIAAENRIDELTSLREQQLGIANRLSRMYVADIDARKRLIAFRESAVPESCS